MSQPFFKTFNEAEDINNEQTRGDLRGTEPMDAFGDEDHVNFTVKVKVGACMAFIS